MAVPIKNGDLTEDFLRVDPPSRTYEEFIVAALEHASPETKGIINKHGKKFTLKAMSYRPTLDADYLLLRSTTTGQAYWLPESEVLLLEDL